MIYTGFLLNFASCLNQPPDLQMSTWHCTYLSSGTYSSILYVPSRNLRSSHQSLLTSVTPATRYGHRSFCVASAELWNNVPLHVKNSVTISQFKTYLFTKTF